MARKFLHGAGRKPGMARSHPAGRGIGSARADRPCRSSYGLLHGDDGVGSANARAAEVSCLAAGVCKPSWRATVFARWFLARLLQQVLGSESVAQKNVASFLEAAIHQLQKRERSRGPRESYDASASSA